MTAIVKWASDRCKTAEFSTNVLWKVFSQIQRLLIQQGLSKSSKMSMFFKNPCRQKVSTDVDITQIDDKRTSVFSRKRHLQYFFGISQLSHMEHTRFGPDDLLPAKVMLSPTRQ
jgi:hypothetical protein